ncbi:alpha/beta hydrolase [Thalassotalea sp. PP2-459]|uniref:alpha/beta hydrolase n=1 Tax=Thalassotalea sp. PP2-459 TaxID=1742724 RepID=UPI000944ECC3|nr:alpha/beta hydrolase-fold protein [Thalassotalea sp. PP2-459]OKY27240.1 esterase [Thalassotalea sp. PP2-459]
MFKNIILAVLLLSSISAHANNPLKITEKSQFSIGDRITFNSTVLSESRILNIYLPSSYESSPDKTYPVIYLLDGSAEEDFIHLAGLVQFGSFSWIQQVPESIVVGIENVDRKRDFTYPTNHPQDQKDFPTSGGSAKFIEFIGSEVQPLIGQNYRTNSNKTIIGQSLGGLLATEILFKAPELFDNYIIISPSLWWDDESLLAQPLKTSATEKLIYIAVGKEGDIMERTAKELFVKVNKQKPKHYSTFFKFFEQLSHGDTLHLAVYNAFDKLFRK